VSATQPAKPAADGAGFEGFIGGTADRWSGETGDPVYGSGGSPYGLGSFNPVRSLAFVRFGSKADINANPKFAGKSRSVLAIGWDIKNSLYVA
jgi:hypothetical protein